jgi:hypothetical protein
METKLCKTGIDVLGDMPWGMHVCHFYRTKEDLTDIILPYIKAGLEDNESCIWVTMQPLDVEDAKLALKKEVRNLDDYFAKKQLLIVDSYPWYTKLGKLETYMVLMDWNKKEREALTNGFDGLRVTGNASWLDSTGWKDFVEYEAIVDYSIGSHRMLAICSYSLDKYNTTQLKEVALHHHFTLAKESDKWTRLSRAYYSRK